MSNYLLSICIPTYNYGEFIGQTLSCLQEQINEKVEIIVGDSNSTDNTESVVRKFISKNNNIKYFNFNRKSGIDIDLAKTIDKASGEYCWLLSSDDLIVKNGVKTILDEIKFKPNVILTNRIICNKEMHPIKKNVNWLNNKIGDFEIDFNENRSLEFYLNSLNSIGGLFSYMSVLIFKRDDWLKIDSEEKYQFHCYAHSFNLFKILKLSGSKLKYLSKKIVLFRGFNDSFASEGYIKRILIDLNGYKLIQENLFPHGKKKRLFLKIMRKEHPWYYLIRLKNESNSFNEWKSLENKLKSFQYSSIEIILIRIFGSSNLLINFLRKLKRLLKI